MTRTNFTRGVKLDAWMRAKGHCAVCTAKIRPGNGPHYDHVVPDALGGDATVENCQVLCRTCHDLKTRQDDVPRIAKAKRVHDNHINARSRRNRPFRKPPPGWNTWTRQWRET